jgi:hypothetical protein
MSGTLEYNGLNCDVTGLYLFDGSVAQSGAVLYVFTDKGTFVRLYESWLDEGKWYNEEVFREKAAAYYKLISSYEYNDSADGQAKNGGITFNEFLENYDNDDNSVKPDSTISKTTDELNDNKNTNAGLIIFFGAIITGAIAIVIAIIHCLKTIIVVQ